MAMKGALLMGERQHESESRQQVGTAVNTVSIRAGRLDDITRKG